MANAISASNIHLRYKNAEKRRLFHKTQKSEDVLKGISFDVEKGEVFGIIGPNGSGKSTLMRVLAGLMSTEEGSVELYGNSISLLALGVGFHNNLSGKDNIYISGMLMGYSKKEIDKKYMDIAGFSELEDYLDKPVKTYSSGMRSKLTFSIAINLRTDIILIDEVFSVGDMRFKAKSKAAMEEMIQEDNLTVLMVSHNLGEIKKMCKRVMWIENGEVRAIGDTNEILEQYHKSMADSIANVTYLDPPSVKVVSGSKSIHISWDAIENATDYRVYRKENIKGSRWSQIADGFEGLEFDDIPPSDKIEYLYTARARMNNGKRNIWSEFVTAGPGKIKE